MAQAEQNLSDDQLVERVIRGDKEAYAVLINKYKNLLYRLALDMLSDTTMAEDIAQEAFIIAYENIGRLKNTALFGSWIAGIAKNLCRDIKKKQKNAPLSLDSLSDDGFEPANLGNLDTIDKELVSNIHKIIGKLPEKYRQIMHLRFTEDFSYEKLSNFLGISMSAVKSRLFHAKNEIIKKLKKEGLL